MRCTCESCEDRGRSFTPGKFIMKYDKKLKRVVPELCNSIDGMCPSCGSQMVFCEVENSVPEFSVGVFKGLSDEKKKEILRQRFDKDVKRNSRDEMEGRKKGTISKLIGYDKN